MYEKNETFLYELSRKFLQSFPVYIGQLSVSDTQNKLRYDYFLFYLEII